MTQRLFSICILIGALTVASTLTAQNRYFFQGDTSVLTGSTGHSVQVVCDNDIEVLGFSFAVNYDPDAIDVTDITQVGTAAAEADYFGGQLDENSGLIGYGCVFDLDGDFSTQKLAAGDGHVLASIEFNVTATTDTDMELSLEDVAIAPNVETPVRNVLTNGQGQSVVPNLENGTVQIRVEAPEITSVQGSPGNAGDVIQVIGQNFAHAGLTVEICDVAADATLRGDEITIDVTVPECFGRNLDILDCYDVVVSTVRGSDTDPGAFCYSPDPKPTLDSVAPTEGYAGDVVTITGSNFHISGFAVTVCGNNATIDSVAGDGTSADIVLPNCPEGPADIEVENDFGTAGPVQIEILVDPTDTFVRGDPNSDGSIDLTDGVAILAFLFQGAAKPRCEDAADTDDNGNLDLSDAIKIFNWLFLGGSPPVAPSPSRGGYPAGECGVDVDDSDAFGCDQRSDTCSS